MPMLIVVAIANRSASLMFNVCLIIFIDRKCNSILLDSSKLKSFDTLEQMLGGNGAVIYSITLPYNAKNFFST